jgi:tripartite-type tricarboxylate transporter receptor subunit TctC
MKLPHRRQFLHLTAGAAALPVVSRVARAQAYPSRPVRVVVPFAPGGPTDIFARLMGQKMNQQFGKQFYIENVAGASGNIGTAQVAKAAPDGHTILINVNNFAINPVFYDKVPYDPFKDFEAITLAVTNDVAFVINPSVPARTVAELVALIKAGTGKYTFASGGTGSVTHLLGEQFKQSLGLDLVHVPYNGGGPSIAAVVAGHTQMAFSSTPQAVSQISSGTLRAIAITGKTRSQSLPNVPTMAEAGFPETKGDQWVGVFAPARTPKDIIGVLNREIAKSLTLPDLKVRFAELGFVPVGSSAEEFTSQIRSDMETWGKVIRAGNLKPD